MPRFSRGLPSVATLLVSALFLSTACKNEEKVVEQNQVPTAIEQNQAQEKPQAANKAPTKKPPIATLSGVAQVVLPGRGLSSIRFGATRETIERQMQAPCAYASEKRCVYVDRGLEFFLNAGVLEKIRIHIYNHNSDDVPNAERNYGAFNGVLPAEIRPGLHRHIVLSEYGEPSKQEKIKKPPAFGLQERHFYDGITLEYDRIENGNIVLAAMEIFPSKTALTPKAHLEKLRQKKLKEQKPKAATP